MLEQFGEVSYVLADDFIVMVVVYHRQPMGTKAEARKMSGSGEILAQHRFASVEGLNEWLDDILGEKP